MRYGLWINRQSRFVIRDHEACLLVIIGELNASLLQLFAILIAQDGQQQLVAQLRFQGVPVNIEVIRELGGAAIFQHVAPPRIVFRNGNVVGNNIEHQAHAMRLQLTGEAAEIIQGANLGVELIVVGDVVAVQAAGTRLEQRRGVNMGDAQALKVRHKLPRLLQAKARVKLQTVRSQRACLTAGGGQPVKTLRVST